MAEGSKESGVTDDDVEWRSACRWIVLWLCGQARCGNRVGRDRHNQVRAVKCDRIK